MKLKLKEFRKAKKLTQQEVAKFLNIAPTTYLGYEKGIINPTIETFEKLADFYNVTIDALVGHETKNVLDVSIMSLTKIDFINQIKTLDDKNIENLNSFLQGMLYAQRERQNIIDQVKKYKGDD